MENIVLIGFMGSGKSTIAKELSNELKIPYIDSDIYIEEQEKMSIKDIFKIKGEKYFRALELKFIESFYNIKNHIIATGGGMPIFNDINKLGICIYLNAEFNTIKNRIGKSNANNKCNRPLFDDISKAKLLYNQRVLIYEQKSNYCVNANHDKYTITKKIMQILDINKHI